MIYSRGECWPWLRKDRRSPNVNSRVSYITQSWRATSESLYAEDVLACDWLVYAAPQATPQPTQQEKLPSSRRSAAGHNSNKAKLDSLDHNINESQFSDMQKQYAGIIESISNVLV